MFEGIFNKLKILISGPRLSHSIGVAEEARRLAVLYGQDPEKSYLAGLLHDSARAFSNEVLVKYLPPYFLAVGYSIPAIFHAFAGPQFVSEQFGITDYLILRAIGWHATACEDMSDFDKILFVADITESGRQFRETELVRQVFHHGLEKAYLQALELKIGYLLSSKKIIYPVSLEAWNKVISSFTGDTSRYAQT